MSTEKYLRPSNFPEWVSSKDDECLVGEALGFGGESLVLSSQSTCMSFVQTKRSLQMQSQAQATYLSLRNQVLEQKLLEEITSMLREIKFTGKEDISSVSFSELSRLQLRELEKRNVYSVFPAIGGDAVLSREDQQNLWSPPPGKLTRGEKKAARNESYLCMKMTMHLKKLFELKDDILVNSEELKWIVTRSEHAENYMKPDFFVTRKGLQKSHVETGSKAICGFRKLPENAINYEFGTLCNWNVRDCVTAVIEFKVKLTPEDFGKLVCYLQHLCRGDPSNTFYGMVCDNEEFWLTSCTDTAANTRIDAKWTDPGSMNLIREFFSKRNSWRLLLDYCCESLGVSLVETDAFLGCGAFGRAFTVVDTKGVQHALKIVHSTDPKVIAAVCAEISTMLAIKHLGGNCATITQSVQYFDPHLSKVTGVGYLMQEVGSCLSKEECRSNGSKTILVFEALYSLYRLYRYHGDPRLPNLIDHHGKLIWIDFMQATNAANIPKANFPLYAENDFKTLFMSIYGEKPSGKIETLVKKYSQTLKLGDFETLLAEITVGERIGGVLVQK